MARFQMVPTVALRLDGDCDIRDFGAWVPGPVVRSKFDEPIRLFICLGHFSSRDIATAELTKHERNKS